MRNLTQVSIIFPTSGNLGLTLDCLKSINDQTLPRDQIETIIVDNESRGENRGKILQKFPWVKIIPQKKNLKFSEAINLGAKKASGKYLFISNNDVIIEKDFFEKLLNFAQSDPQIGVCGCKIITRIGNRNYQDSPASISRLSSQITKLKNYSKIQEVDWISGAGLLVKKYIFDLLGGFDVNFPFYFEDLDFCLRVKHLGMRVVYFPRTKMYHLRSSTVKTKSPGWKNDVWYQGKLYLIRKHFPYWGRPVSNFAQFLFCFYLLLIKRENRLGSLLRARKYLRKIPPEEKKSEKRKKITKSQIEAYYRQGKVFTARNSAPFQQNVLNDFYNFLKKHENLKKWHILEFGVGHGWNLPLMVKNFGKITGVDIAPAAIVESGEYGFRNVALKVLKRSSLPFKKDSFDLIVATEVLEHVPDLEKTVAEFGRVVKLGGYILVSVPTYLNLRGISKKIMEAILGEGTWEPARSHPGGFERFLTPGKILSKFSDYKIVDTRGLYYGIAWSPPRVPLYPDFLSPFFDMTLGKFGPLKRLGMNFFFLAQKIKD